MELLMNTVVEWYGRKVGALKPSGMVVRAGVKGNDILWLPFPSEVRECCKKLKWGPSTSFPFAFKKHCCSLKHVAALRGVDPKEITKAVKTLTLLARRDIIEIINEKADHIYIVRLHHKVDNELKRRFGPDSGIKEWRQTLIEMNVPLS